MSKARTINDYYATVFLHRYHTDKPSKTGERIEIVVRIPEEAAKILFGSGRRGRTMPTSQCLLVFLEMEIRWPLYDELTMSRLEYWKARSSEERLRFFRQINSSE